MSVLGVRVVLLRERAGTPPGALQTPETWTLATSLSNEQDIFTPLKDVADQLEHLDFSDGVHRVRQRSTGQIKFIAGEASTFGGSHEENPATPQAQTRSETGRLVGTMTDEDSD